MSITDLLYQSDRRAYLARAIILWITCLFFPLAVYWGHPAPWLLLYFASGSICFLFAFYINNQFVKFILSLIPLLMLLLAPTIFAMGMEELEEVLLLVPLQFVLLYPGKLYINLILFILTPIYFLYRNEETLSAIFEDLAELIIVTFLAALLSFQFERLGKRMKIFRWNSYHDELTGFSNRRAFFEVINKKSSEQPKNDNASYLLFFDVLDFKSINDRFNIETGDNLLLNISSRLKDTIPRHTEIFHLLGNQFCIFIEDFTPQLLSEYSDKLINALRQPYLLGELTIDVNFLISGVQYPQDATNPSQLIRNANLVFHELKEKCKNRLQMFDANIGNKASERFSLLDTLKNNMTETDFSVFYQPQFDLNTGELISVEALVRWVHPSLGLQPPFTFISLAEETGLIQEIDMIVLKKACQFASSCLSNYNKKIKISTNLSVSNLKSANLINNVKSILENSGLDSSQLQLEITESELMLDAESSLDVLSQLKSIGVSIAIDDFGVKYSSFSYLKNIPADTLKLDRVFIKDLESNDRDRSIIRTIINLSHSLSMKTIAEGVETKGQLEFLEESGCDLYQGFLTCRPIPEEEFIEKYMRQ